VHIIVKLMYVGKIYVQQCGNSVVTLSL